MKDSEPSGLRHGHRVSTFLIVFIFAGCGDPIATSDSATYGEETAGAMTAEPTTGSGMPTTGQVDPTAGLPPSAYCANPQFAGGSHTGTRYTCEGAINDGSFSFQYCTSDDPACIVPVYAAMTSKSFPYEATEGNCLPMPTIEACCVDSVEEDSTGGYPEEVERACISDCAHEACRLALKRLEELHLDLNFIDQCEFAADQSACEANLRLSLDAYAAALQADFAACVNAVVDDDWTMSLGTAPCLGEGCLQDAVLHISCSVDPVEFGVTGESPQPCYEAPHQPPPFFESTCDIGEGEVTITSGIETWSTSITSGSTSYRNFFCEDSGCSVVLDGLALSVDDFAVGDYVLHHVEVSLHTPAIGYMDGQVVTFPAGAIRIDIAAGTRWEGAGTPPFGYDPPFADTTSNSQPATASIANGRLIFDTVVFGYDGYGITVELEPATCDSPLPFAWVWLGYPDNEPSVSWVKADPVQPEVLYVGYNDGVLVSENYGLTWDVFAAGDWPQEDQFAFDPNDPDTIYMVVGSDIYVTHDKAQTPWTMLAEQLPEGYSITTLHPSTDGTLYVGTFNPFTNPEDPGIFKWDGGPGPFVYVEFPTNAYEDPLNATSLFTHVIADDPAHDMVYLGGELTPVPGSEYNPFPDPEDDPSPVGYDAPNLRSTSGGSTWENMNNGSISSHVTSLIVDPGDSRIYAAQEGSTLWASDDLGVCWQPLATAGYPALVLDSNDNTRFFGGSWGPTDDVPEWKRGGVWVSTDRGAHFAAAGLQGDHPVVGDPSQYTTSVAVNSTSARIYATGYFGTGLWSAPIPAGL